MMVQHKPVSSFAPVEGAAIARPVRAAQLSNSTSSLEGATSGISACRWLAMLSRVPGSRAMGSCCSLRFEHRGWLGRGLREVAVLRASTEVCSRSATGCKTSFGIQRYTLYSVYLIKLTHL